MESEINKSNSKNTQGTHVNDLVEESANESREQLINKEDPLNFYSNQDNGS
jgi:hypothetical protein